MGAMRAQGIEDYFQHRCGLFEYLVVPESQHSKALQLDIAVTIRIIRVTLEVLSAIELDDQVGFETGEVDDVASDRELPAKAISSKLTAPEVSPEKALGVSCPSS